MSNANKGNTEQLEFTGRWSVENCEAWREDARFLSAYPAFESLIWPIDLRHYKIIGHKFFEGFWDPVSSQTTSRLPELKDNEAIMIILRECLSRKLCSVSLVYNKATLRMSIGVMCIRPPGAHGWLLHYPCRPRRPTSTTSCGLVLRIPISVIWATGDHNGIPSSFWTMVRFSRNRMRRHLTTS